MYCEKCGSEIPREAKFCEKCGSRVEAAIQRKKEDSSHKKWILGGIISGVAFVSAVTVGVLFAMGVIESKDEAVQISIDVQSDAGVSDTTVQSTDRPTATPVITPSPTPEPTEVLVESDKPAEKDVSGEFDDKDDLMGDRTPEETYKQYIETFVEAVNTGDTGGI